MLEPPAIPHAALADCLAGEYGVRAVVLDFLPIGADLGTAVYRATAAGGSRYFVKLRLTPFDEIAALLPRWLAEQEIAEVMAPLPSRSGRPWAERDEFTLLLYPFVEGRDGYNAVLSDDQWRAFGRAMRAIHDAPLPPVLAVLVPHETYDARWRDRLRDFMVEIKDAVYTDPVAQRLASFLAERRAEVMDLVERTERLTQALRASPGQEVVCHTDLHAGNLLLADDGRLFIVDWDAPQLAPRERDLMYPGGGQGFLGHSPDEEAALFYSGYGRVDVKMAALAYYRLERIIEDLAVFCSQLLGPVDNWGSSDHADREQALRWAMSNFQPANALEIAYQTAAKAERANAGLDPA